MLWGGGAGYTCALFYSFCATLPSSKLRGKTDHGSGSGSRAPHRANLALAAQNNFIPNLNIIVMGKGKNLNPADAHRMYYCCLAL